MTGSSLASAGRRRAGRRGRAPGSSRRVAPERLVERAHARRRCRRRRRAASSRGGQAQRLAGRGLHEGAGEARPACRARGSGRRGRGRRRARAGRGARRARGCRGRPRARARRRATTARSARGPPVSRASARTTSSTRSTTASGAGPGGRGASVSAMGVTLRALRGSAQTRRERHRLDAASASGRCSSDRRCACCRK